ncbi:MAG: hypothetical protein P8020_18695 [Acidobacteriota bacterium]
MSPYTYGAYGLGIESEIPFPELPPSDREPQISVRYHAIDLRLEGGPAICTVRDRECLIGLERIGKFAVRDGREILVEPAAGVDSVTIRVALLGLCLAVILHQRGILPLHASSIRTPGGAVLFTGPTGCGKSTLLAAFLKRGHRMLADDVSGIFLGPGGVPQVLPAFPQTRLWRDSAGKLGHDVAGPERVLADLDKFTLSTAQHFADEPSSLRAIYVLEPWDESTTEIEELENSAKFGVFVGNTYCKPMVDGLGLRPSHFRLAVAAAQASVVKRVRRPNSGFRLDELTDRIEQDLRAMGPQRH